MNKTEQYLNSLKCEDISIIADDPAGPILILLCPDGQEADKLLHLLKNNPFVLEVHVNKSTGEHDLKISLTDTEYGVGFHSPLTLETYPPLKLLHNKQVIGITCGFYDNKQLVYNQEIHPIDGNQVALN